ncbi:MAG: N-acetyltransferase [Caulobacter sp.]|nr:N-acetyltransferase [Caulobacter sp.]
MTDAFRDNREENRFELEVDGLLAFADYQRRDGRLVIPHVEADMALRGTGAAGWLMEKVALAARQEGAKIVPLCSYAAAWLRRHKDFDDVVA